MSRSRLEPTLLLLALGAGLWLALSMPVFSQESYYWCYSQHPDLSYYDHPPMVAWLIWLGSQVFGDGAMGIRLGSWLCGCATVLGGLSLLRAFEAPPTSRLVWLALCLGVPNLVAVRFLTNPDPPLCAFWMLTLVALWRSRSGGLGWWALAGLMAGGALLSKYTAIFLAPAGALLLLIDPKMRRQLLKPGPYVGVLVAALTFLPVIWWNVANDFESFRFQTEGRWERAGLGVKWLGQFVGGQLLVLNPVVAVATVASTWWLWRRGRGGDMRATWLLAFGVPMAAFLLCSSLFVQVKINWLTPAALPLLLGMTLWWTGAEFVPRHPVAVRRLRYVLIGFAAVIAIAPVVRLMPPGRGSRWVGWEETVARVDHWRAVVDREDERSGNLFYFAGDYRDAAQLTRHLKNHAKVARPGVAVEPTLAQNAFGLSALQFDHWEPPAKHIGEDGLLVLPRPDMRQGLLERIGVHFASLELLERVEVQRLGFSVFSADIYRGRNYLGPKLP
ncbi:MAG: glycosyltransferase family 39 protein [Planctomycetes bacterium]|nr:glycosyltransferase family 39 protein [Planctomycetota bacterium]